MDCTVTSKGQVTLPEDMMLQEGDRVMFTPLGGGHYILTPFKESIRDLCGFLPPPAEPVTLEDMEQSIREGAARSSACIQRDSALFSQRDWAIVGR